MVKTPEQGSGKPTLDQLEGFIRNMLPKNPEIRNIALVVGFALAVSTGDWSIPAMAIVIDVALRGVKVVAEVQDNLDKVRAPGIETTEGSELRQTISALDEGIFAANTVVVGACVGALVGTGLDGLATYVF